VSLFVLSPEIEHRDEVEAGNWAKHKKTFSTTVYFERNEAIFIFPTLLDLALAGMSRFRYSRLLLRIVKHF
jgi:hypothetical protein